MGAAGAAWSSSGLAVAVSCSLSVAMMVVMAMAMGVPLPAELCLPSPLPLVCYTGHVCEDWFCCFAASSCHPTGLLLAWLDSVGISGITLGCLVLLEWRNSPTCHPGPDGFSCMSELSLLCHPSSDPCPKKYCGRTKMGQKWWWCCGPKASLLEQARHNNPPCISHHGTCVLKSH